MNLERPESRLEDNGDVDHDGELSKERVVVPAIAYSALRRCLRQTAATLVVALSFSLVNPYQGSGSVSICRPLTCVSSPPGCRSISWSSP